MRLSARTIGVALLVIAGMVAAPAAAQSIPTPPPKTRPTAEQVFQVYAGRTWLWQDGAGYFAPDWRFVAWSGSGQKASYASGKWRTDDLGRMCFTATWTGADYSAPATTCFSHRIDGKVLYQAREPNGMWYIFRHDPVRKRDEYLRLERGDRATAGFERNRLALGGAPLRRSWWHRCHC